MTSFLPADNPTYVKPDWTSCSEFGQISLGTHTVQMVSKLSLGMALIYY